MKYDIQHEGPTGGIPLAVCGIALRLPGGVSTPEEFWDMLVSKRDARAAVPLSRYNAESFYSSSGKSGLVRSKHGYFLDESVDIGALDTNFFTLPKQAVEKLDHQQRLLLELVHECFESAGECDYRGRDIGCWVGAFTKDWTEQLTKDAQANGLYKVGGHGEFLLSNRVSYEFDLKGPSMTIGTACSSSLVGLHDACRSLRIGECDGAIVAGVNLILSPSLTVDLTEEGVLSPDASCRTFDADADGYARAEAVNVLHIKRLDDALRDRSPIRAVIRGTAANADGRTPGITQPSSGMQVKLIKKAYKDAGITDFSKTGFFECHGTGTPVGDTIETTAVGEVFGQHGVLIGSVKPNVGHGGGASGITSLIKAILSLENLTVPPNIKFVNPNPKIKFAEDKLAVPTESMAWPKDREERISVNSFGIGGANAHVLVDSARSFLKRHESSPIIPEPKQSHSAHSLMVYSGSTFESVQRHVENTKKFMAKFPDTEADVAYTLTTRRIPQSHRSFSVMRQGTEFMSSSILKTSKSHPAVAMVFTGQGAQYPRMGAELYQTNKVFSSSINRMDEALAGISDGPEWTIAEELMKSHEDSRVYTPQFSQPLCTAVQMALVDVLTDLGVHPYAVVGHSSGEVAGAYAAGKLTASECIIVAYYRGLLSGKITRMGSMAALGMGRVEAESFLVPGVCIACENSPSSVTISGDTEELDKVLDAVRRDKPDILARRLNVDRAYHSYHMREIGPMYEASASRYIFKGSSKQHCQFFSTTSGQQLLSKDLTDSLYWRNNLENLVLFHTAVKNLINYRRESNSGSDDLVFLEVGPHSALAGPLRQILKEQAYTSTYISCLVRKKDAEESFLAAMGNLFVQNVNLDLSKLTDPDGDAKVVTNLPTYPWHHDQSFMFETRLTKEWRWQRFKKHELLGIRVPESPDDQPCWRNLFTLDQVPWIRDHVVRGDVVFPCAAYIAMVEAAIGQLTGVETLGGCSLREVTIGTAMVLSDNSPTEIVTSLKRVSLTDSFDSGWHEFAIYSHNGTSWNKHCTGQGVARSCLPTGQSLAEKPSGFPRSVEMRQWYDATAAVGGQHGPLFQGIKNVSSSTTACEAKATAFPTYQDDETEYPIHPTMTDTVFQMFALASYNGLGRRVSCMNVPTHIGTIDIFSTRGEIDIDVKSKRTVRGTLLGDGEGYSSNGDLALRIHGMKLDALPNDDPDDDIHAGARVVWRPLFDFSTMGEVVKQHPDQQHLVFKLQAVHDAYVRKALQNLEGVIVNPLSHLLRFREWLTKQPLPQSNTDIEKAASDLECSMYGPILNTMRLVLDNIVAIFNCNVEPLEILMQDDSLTHLYDCLNSSDRGEMIRLLAHAKPNLRILEIGAGTGGTTNTFLQHLKSPIEDDQSFSLYTYTDISAGFFTTAQERFHNYKDIEFQVLDISENPLAQGFEPESYDLIIAANVLHATPCLQDTLRNVRKLMRPDGHLYLEELCCETKAINFIMGVLPGWWLGADEDRYDEPYVSPQRWDAELQLAGFDGLSGIALDCKEPYQLVANLTSRPTSADIETPEVCLLRDESTSSEFLRDLECSLTNAGYTVTMKHLGAEPLAHRVDVIICFDLERPYLEAMNEKAYDTLQVFLKDAADSGSGVLWLTQPSQIHCDDPRWAEIIGAARTIRRDLDMDLATCEIEGAHDSSTWDLVVHILRRFQKRHQLGMYDDLDPEYEYAITNGKVHVGRAYPVSVSQELQLSAASTPESSDPALDLHIGSFGPLDTLHWASRSDERLGDNEVELDTKAVGLNFKDILTAMGVIDAVTTTFGFEAAGVIRQVGAGVRSSLKVGDRVVVAGKNYFSTRVRIDSDLCVPIPDGLSFEDTASMPCVYLPISINI